MVDPATPKPNDSDPQPAQSASPTSQPATAESVAARSFRIVADHPSGNSSQQESPRQFERIATHNLSLFFGERRILDNVSLSIPANQVTSIIGPTGSGKSSLLRCFNRMNDFVEGARIEGEVLLDGSNIYQRHIDVARLRKRIGMVFHESKPFPTSVFENVAYAPRIAGTRDADTLQQQVRHSLQLAGIWDEVRNRLDEPASRLSHGQQYRLCIARSLAADPEVLLMDEPTSSLDPAATARVEDLIFELKKEQTIVLVTNNIQQAARISDRTAFLFQGHLVEAGMTTDVFTNPGDSRTEDYVRGRFG